MTLKDFLQKYRESARLIYPFNIVPEQDLDSCLEQWYRLLVYKKDIKVEE